METEDRYHNRTLMKDTEPFTGSKQTDIFLYIYIYAHKTIKLRSGSYTSFEGGGGGGEEGCSVYACSRKYDDGANYAY